MRSASPPYRPIYPFVGLPTVKSLMAWRSKVSPSA